MSKAACILLLAVLAAPITWAEPFTWVDEWSLGDLPTYGQVSVPLVSLKPPSLSALPTAFREVRCSAFTFYETAETKTTLAAVLHEPGGAAPELHVDANADGKLAADEQARVAAPDERPAGFGKPGETVWLIQLTKPHPRLVAFRLNPFGGLLTCALRGYMRGSLPVEGGAVDALLVEADANMRLDPGQDRLYLDEDRNGTFEPIRERRACPPRLGLAGAAFTFSEGRLFHEAQWYLAPTGDVPLRGVIAGLKAVPERIIACLSRAGGGLYQVASTDETTKLPAGSYSVESVFLKLPASDGETWTYTFDRREAAPPTEVQGADPVSLELLGNLALGVTYSGKPAPGQTLRVEVNVRSATGLTMTGCTKGQLNIGGMGTIPAKLVLLGPTGARPVYESSMGFG
ncbi:MAG: hypothetical protein FJX75_12905 [Armatimonadetes bacterium]|nr:hypothetical protein [Armatimonadota bacterium]